MPAGLISYMVLSGGLVKPVQIFFIIGTRRT